MFRVEAGLGNGGTKQQTQDSLEVGGSLDLWL